MSLWYTAVFFVWVGQGRKSGGGGGGGDIVLQGFQSPAQGPGTQTVWLTLLTISLF